MHRTIGMAAGGALMALLMFGCQSDKGYWQLAEAVELDRFMGDWFVVATRPTSFEDGAHNPIERYEYNQAEQRIDISFIYNEDAFDGPIKTIGQKGWVQDDPSNAYWKISPFWPLKFDYIVLAVAEDYSWTAVGVPNQKYLWIMARESDFAREQIDEIVADLAARGYATNDIIYPPHQPIAAKP